MRSRRALLIIDDDDITRSLTKGCLTSDSGGHAKGHTRTAFTYSYFEDSGRQWCEGTCSQRNCCRAEGEEHSSRAHSSRCREPAQAGAVVGRLYSHKSLSWVPEKVAACFELWLHCQRAEVGRMRGDPYTPPLLRTEFEPGQSHAYSIIPLSLDQ